MGLLDDAIREHLELKRRSGAAEDEVTRLESEVLAAAPAPEPEPPLPEEPAVEIMPIVEEPVRPEPEAWLEEEEEPATAQPTSEFSAEELAEAHGEATAEYVAPDEEPGEDLLEETPDFLQETPEHDRLWFEQKPPKDFDFGG